MNNIIEGIIYKTLDYKESSKLLYVYTPKGKITLVANNVLNMKNNNRFLSQYLTHISFVGKDKQMYSLENASLINDFNKIKTNYDNIKLVSKLFIVIDKAVTPDLEHEKIFNELVKVLNSDNISNATLSLLLKLLKPLGFEPTFFIENKKTYGFDLQKGSIVTSKDDTYDIGLDDLMKMMIYYYKPYNELPLLSEEENNQLQQIISKYYKYHLLIEI